MSSPRPRPLHAHTLTAALHTTTSQHVVMVAKYTVLESLDFQFTNSNYTLGCLPILRLQPPLISLAESINDRCCRLVQ